MKAFLRVVLMENIPLTLHKLEKSANVVDIYPLLKEKSING